MVPSVDGSNQAEPLQTLSDSRFAEVFGGDPPRPTARPTTRRTGAWAGSVLIYDGDCGFCRRSLGWARRLGATCPAQPWQAIDLAAVDLSEAQVIEAAWYVDDAGRRYGGHEAIAMTLRSSRWRLVRLLGRVIGSRVLRPVAAPAYAWVARNRHRMPGATKVRRVD